MRPTTFASVLTLLLPLNLAAQGAPGSSADAAPDRDLDRIRNATAAYHDIEAARAAGYAPTDHCMEAAAGGMGHHFINSALLDDRLELERPEILVYAPTRNGALKLAGVEYVVPFAAWTRAESPVILGRALKRSDALGIWYLHVWVWEANPDGVFADWNPVVRCSG
jgi:hypothetical protein